MYGLAVVGGVRTKVLQNLRSFNGFRVESKEAFRSIAVKPPYYCIYETKRAKIGSAHRLISALILNFHCPRRPLIARLRSSQKI